jgi:hypothetical protein
LIKKSAVAAVIFQLLTARRDRPTNRRGRMALFDKCTTRDFASPDPDTHHLQ